MPGKPRPAVVRCMLWLGAVHTYSLGSPAPRGAGSGPQIILPP